MHLNPRINKYLSVSSSGLSVMLTIISSFAVNLDFFYLLHLQNDWLGTFSSTSVGYQYNYNESVTVDTFKESAVTRLPLTGVNFLEKMTFAADRVAYAFQIVLGGEYLN